MSFYSILNLFAVKFIQIIIWKEYITGFSILNMFSLNCTKIYSPLYMQFVFLLMIKFYFQIVETCFFNNVNPIVLHIYYVQYTPFVKRKCFRFQFKNSKQVFSTISHLLHIFGRNVLNVYILVLLDYGIKPEENTSARVLN